jgi:hypothetical protein
VLDVAGVDDDRVPVETEGGDGRGDLRRTAGRGNRPTDPGVLDGANEATDARQRPRIDVELLVNLAGPTIDHLGPVIADPVAVEGGDLPGQSATVEADQRCQPVATDRQVNLDERLFPGRDPVADGVDECSVQVEQDGIRPGEPVDGKPHSSIVIDGAG